MNKLLLGLSLFITGIQCVCSKNRGLTLEQRMALLEERPEAAEKGRKKQKEC